MLTKILVILEDGNELPSWWRSKPSVLTFDLSSRKDNTSRFDGFHKNIGEDQNYKFYLDETGILEPLRLSSNLPEKYKMCFSITCEPKTPSVNKLKRFLLPFEIFPPIYI
jgi:hypothetical protein